MRKVIVGFSGGITSAWCAGWALRTFPKEEVVLLWHDTKAEDEDTYRFLRQMAAKLDMPITERSDGRSLEEVVRDNNMLPNDNAAFCSYELKQKPGNEYIRALQEEGCEEIIRVIGYSKNEPSRVQFATALAWKQSSFFCTVTPLFPLIETGTTKQQCADWCTCDMGIQVPRMYEWSDHANCPGCFRGGKAYWLAVKENMPEVFEQRKRLEAEFNHTIMGRYSLVQVELEGMKRPVQRREAISIGSCECGS